ncbi:hypothetical protein [Clostridium cochlearium]|uniref:hypothetical protein n=1 Tax=Clostridium cochlearium TaxID=1494 RepID=UPI001C0F12E1|nr:hypothetical protein [Clostridium cochlearium]MBU5269475.1 hypothetical protein [Clostridium cochlearium]
MDSIKKIAISHIADILANKNLIPVKNDIWKIIFYNSGQSKLFDENRYMFKENINVYEGVYEHNSKCYSALQKVFSQLVDDNKGFIILLNNIALKINMYNIFEENIEKKLKCIYTHDILEYLKKKDYSYKQKILEQYPSRDFKKIRDNLNLLGLDIIFDKGGFQLTVMPFSITEKQRINLRIKQCSQNGLNVSILIF